ncbi:MAG: AarF/ABC1/UbiB kinase family protein [Alphaproteobacteria bacterium]|nr:AarF/ABC1/UbiB kinase family protein [Alphaproteobacteria bacterium]MBT7941851.1 AarF/ABC1/UbiB kinase family protein [Alphaproteobacteria bacterium]
MNENDNLSGRVKRYAKVGAKVGGYAARTATSRLFGVTPDRSIQAEALHAVLGGLKGPLMKVAQIMATLPDVMPEEFTEELAKLQSNAPSMGWAFVKRRMKGELGADWQDNYKFFDEVAAKAASLGQVHRAQNLKGQDLACKIQYPDMASVVEADLSQLKLAFAVYRRYDPAIDPSEIHVELADRLREELDYRREAANMKLFGEMLKAEEGVHVPRLEEDLSTGRLLSMSWLEGAPLMQFVDEHLELRNTVARNMFRAWYVPFYQYGVIHGDPHLGNYTVRPDGGVNLMDFGCIRVFKASFVGAVIDLYKALRDNDEALAVHAYETWGFVGLDRTVIDILNQWAKFLYAPMLEDRVKPIQSDGGVSYGAGVAAKVHRELREIGGVTPPREFVLVDRAAIGLGSVFTHLKAEINWHRMFHELVDGFDEKKLARHQKKTLKAFDIPLAD